MANRYLRASGNWNGSVWAATEDGAAGSAGTPVAGDVVYIMDGSLTLTLNVDTPLLHQFYLRYGTLNLNSYSLNTSGLCWIGVYYGSENNAATLNMGAGRLAIGGDLRFSSNSSVNAGTSQIELNYTSSTRTFGTSGKTLNDVVINLGSSANSVTANITGSPTFRSLIIQSKNSAAHTVNFDGNVQVDKLVMIGSSISNRLALSASSAIILGDTDLQGTVYGQFVDMGANVITYESAQGYSYIGSNSVDNTGGYWLTQDPPKISTLADPLTTSPGSNTNWSVTGTVTQATSGHDGGGYQLASGATMVSTDTFDLLASELVVETSNDGLMIKVVETDALDIYISGQWVFVSTRDSSYVIEEGPDGATKFVKLAVSSGGVLSVKYSNDGTSWVDGQLGDTYSLTESEVALIRSVRLKVTGSNSVLGSINPSLNAPPTTTLNSPANNTVLTTDKPALKFTGTDPEGEDVTYEVQIDDNSGFSSPDSFLSAEDSGFSGTDPYDSGVEVTYTVQNALTKGGIDYWWRARAKDPEGSNSFGAWSTARKMTTEAIAPSVTSGSSSSISTTSATVSGNVTAANGASITERGFVYGTSSNPTTSNSKKTVPGTTGSFNTSLTGLTPNTTYYWRAYAINSKGTSYGANQSFATLPRPPVVSTGTASGDAIDEIEVTGSGITSNPDGQTITEYGVVYGTSTNPTTSGNKEVGSGGSGDFDVTLSSLSEDTTYYIRAYAIWGSGSVAYGSQITYKTQGRPSVTLNSPTTTTSDTKPKLRFTGTDTDNDTITYQVQLHTSDSFDTPLLDKLSAVDTGFSNLSTSKTDPFYSGNQIQYELSTDLQRGSTYYWRARGKDTTGSGLWGEWTTSASFSITAVAPTVTTTSATNITATTADITCAITTDGGATISERGVVYSTSPNPTTADSKKVVSGTSSPYVAELTDLTDSTTYYVRAYATNSAGTSYGNSITFQTSQTPSAPTVVTGEAANTTDITSEFNGSEVTLDGTETVFERGIVFSDTETTPTTDHRRIVAPTAGLGMYSLGMTGLEPETTYYVRAYAINSIGTGYGEVVTFTTRAPFVPDEGDGYWTWSPGLSQATVGRTQATPANSSVNLPLADLNLENGKDYTFYFESVDIDNGEARVVLERYDGGILEDDEITAGTPFTFTYDTDLIHWNLKLYVTGDDAEPENITAVFNDMYLAQESEFSGYVPFTPRGVTEIKLINNQIVDKRRDDVISSIFDQIEGIEWYPFEIATEGLGYFEIGDRFTIKDDNGEEKSVVVWNTKLTLDGGIKETLYTNKPDLTETDYSKAGNSRLRGNIRRTRLQVDQQAGTINALVSDMYNLDGLVNTKYSELAQNNESIIATVQGSGGVNLIKNSVMYAFDASGVPENWSADESSEGTLTIQASNESLAAGAVSGNQFTLSDMSVSQRVTVRKDVDFIPEENKSYYSISARVKKNTVGTAYIKLSNRNETLTIELPDQTSYYWDIVKIEEILPLDDHYEIEIYSDADAELQVTDLILAPGKTRKEWTQANGEVMNSSVAITDDGITVRSSAFANNFTRISALGFEVHSRTVGGDRIFGFNDDETNVSKLKADKQISMAPIRIVPINYSTYKGWAWTLSEEND